MCYKKKFLKNPVKPENVSGFDKYTIKVPCCQCPSCRRVKANGWLVRSYFEFLGNHRQAFFLSLDFDNEHLPLYKGQPCFDSQIMSKFLKRLRMALGSSFRYLYATDYGGFLKRPHYHMIVLPDKRFSPSFFFDAVRRTWQQGHYTNIEVIDSVNNDKLKALQYVVSYSTKDVTFSLDRQFRGDPDFKLRFRPRVQASKGFGLRALEECVITPDMLLSGKPVSLPVGKNGKLVEFPVPRYYEMKLCYDYYWDDEGSHLRKNQFGVDVAKSRHNVDYLHFLKEFAVSRYLPVDAIEEYKSIFGTRPWSVTMQECYDNYEDFKLFVYYRPFIKSYNLEWVSTTISSDLPFARSWYRYEMICHLYDVYKQKLYDVQNEIETQELIKSAKRRAIKKLERNPGLVRYLRYKHYDFNQLKI